MCQREKCSPKSQGGAHYPEWEHCKLIGFAPDQETELFPEAVTDRSTKINVPLFNTIKRRLPSSSKKLPTTSYYSDPTPPFFPLLEYLFLLQEVVLSLSCSRFFFFFSLSPKQPVKVKGWHFLSKGAICSGENETCMVSRARPAGWTGAEGIPD